MESGKYKHNPWLNYRDKLAQRPENMLMIITGIVMALAISFPLGIVLVTSFQRRVGIFDSIFTVENYARLTSPTTLDAIKNSLLIATGSTLVAGAIGIAMAWLIARTNIPFRRGLSTLNLIPFFLSPMIAAIAWGLLAGPNGLLTQGMMTVFGLEEPPFNIYSLGGIILVIGLFRAPFVSLFCIGPLQNMDPSLEEAARVSGSSWIETTRRITLPLVTPALISALILTFVLGLEELGAVLILGMPYQIYNMAALIFASVGSYPPDYGFGAAVGFALVLMTIGALVLQRRLMRGRSFATVTGRGYRPIMIDLKKGRYVALGINIIYLLFSVFLPMAMLIIVSLQRAWFGKIDWSLFTFQYYDYIFTTQRLALGGIKNSLFLATVGATLSVVLAAIISYGIHRTGSRARSLLDAITTVPIGVPGLIFAVGLLIGLIRTPLYGTLGIILVAYLIRYFAYGQRTLSGVMVSVTKDLEESSRTSGASWFTTVRRVLLPLMWPGIIGSWLLLYLTFMRESSMSLILSRSGTQTISVALYTLTTRDPLGATAALTVVQVFILLIAVFLFLRITGSRGIQV